MMKKIFSLMVLAVLLVTAAACGTTSAKEEAAPVRTTTPQKADAGKTLVVYFSWGGHTRQMAEEVARETGGDLLTLESAKPYPAEYQPTTEVAKVEVDENARPAIKNLPESLDGYDKILVGYPIWWHTAPMIIGTFLESYDFTGKDIYPFTQSASMGVEHFENSMNFVRENIHGGTVHDGLFAEYDDTAAIGKYLTENGLKK